MSIGRAPRSAPDPATGRTFSEPARRGLSRIGTAVGLCSVGACLAGCAALVDVRMLATGRADATAYELSGPDLPVLRREAERLCPLGGEVLRQTAHTQQAAHTDRPWWRPGMPAAGWYAPAPAPAQLVVLCREGAEARRLLPASDPSRQPKAPTAATVPVRAPGLLPEPGEPEPAALAGLPVGPVMPEW